MGASDPDLAALPLDESSPPRRPRTRKNVEPYLRGPIVWSWLRRARLAGPAALPTGLALWHYRALKKGTTFPVSLRDICRLTGQSADSARRGLAALAAAGLITRTDCAGRKPRVTLLEEAPDRQL
jgi:hypothetical protein